MSLARPTIDSAGRILFVETAHGRRECGQAVAGIAAPPGRVCRAGKCKRPNVATRF